MDLTNTTTISSSSSTSLSTWVNELAASLGTILPVLTLIVSFIHRKTLITTCCGKRFTVTVEDVKENESKETNDTSKVSEQTNKTLQVLTGIREKEETIVEMKPLTVPTFKKFSLMFSSRMLSKDSPLT